MTDTRPLQFVPVLSPSVLHSACVGHDTTDAMQPFDIHACIESFQRQVSSSSQSICAHIGSRLPLSDDARGLEIARRIGESYKTSKSPAVEAILFSNAVHCTPFSANTPEYPGVLFVGGDVRRIGEAPDAATIIFSNPTAHTPNLTTSKDHPGVIYMRGTEPKVHGRTDNELLNEALQSRSGIARLGSPTDETSMLSIILRALPEAIFGTNIVYAPKPHKLDDAEFNTWPELHPAFPVFINYKNLGAGLAIRYRAVTDDNGNFHILFAVQPFSPLGLAEGESAPSLLMVPSAIAIRMRLAVTDLYITDNIVRLVNDSGEVFTRTYVDFRMSKDPDYEVARRVLVIKYRHQLALEFSTTLLLDAPPANDAGVASGPRVVRKQPVLVTTTKAQQNPQ